MTAVGGSILAAHSFRPLPGVQWPAWTARITHQREGLQVGQIDGGARPPKVRRVIGSAELETPMLWVMPLVGLQVDRLIEFSISERQRQRPEYGRRLVCDVTFFGERVSWEPGEMRI